MTAAASVVERLNAPMTKNLEPVRIGESFRRHCFEMQGEPTLVRWARAWWRYDGVRYVEHDDERLDRDLIRFLDIVVYERKNEETGAMERKRVTARKSTLAEVRKAITHVMPMLDGGAPQWTRSQPGDPDPEMLVPCANGLLDLRTLELTEPTPRLFATTAIGAPWLADVPEPREWLAFLKSLWGDDKESPRALQQMFGYLLTSDTSHQKMFALVGPRRSGKSTIARILKALLGDDAVVNPTLQSLERPFGLAPLVGKTAAIIGDARLGGANDQAQVVERLLSISGEDPLSIDRKNRDPINVRLRTRVILLSNELPRLYDSSGALASRFVILQMSESFFGREDVTLEKRLLGELPGIFKWAIQGRQDLAEEGRFITPLASMAAIDELENLSAPIRVFVRDCCVLDTDSSVELPALYERYREWCKANGHDKPRPTNLFGRDLHTAFPQLRDTKPRGDLGGRVKLYHGIGLRDRAVPL